MLKNQKGFSLIELMVVVAIIGILSAVAVPQFQKFQRKAKQSEVKAALSGVYLTQKVFRAEHSTYYNNLIAMGYQAEGTLVYNFGFFSSSTGDVVRPASFPSGSVYDPVLFRMVSFVCGTTYVFKATQDTVDAGLQCQWPYTLAVTPNVPTNFVTSSTFQAGAFGDIGGSVIDKWTMSHRKELVNFTNGAL